MFTALKFKKSSTLIYSIFLGVALLILKILETSLFFLPNHLDIIMPIFAIFFSSVGIWLGIQSSYINRGNQNLPKMDNRPIKYSLDEKLSKREFEVLVLMERGMSNQEIANELFVSLNTIKTHSSRLFQKLNASRRSQAIKIAKDKLIL